MSQVLLRAGRALRAFAATIEYSETRAIDMGWTAKNLEELAQELKVAATCNHSNDKLIPLLIFSDVSSEVYQCQCGAVLDLADCRTNFGERPLDSDELQDLVASLVHLKMGEVFARVDVALGTLQTAKERLGRVLKEMREEPDVGS